MTLQRDLVWQQLDLTYRSSVAHRLARYALAMQYSLIPHQVVHEAKRCVLNARGCAIECPGLRDRSLRSAGTNHPREDKLKTNQLFTKEIHVAAV